MTAVDRVLLTYEWQRIDVDSPITYCNACLGENGRHAAGCDWDQALGERGYATQADRDRARLSIAPTEPPAA